MSTNMVACNQSLHEGYQLMQRGMLQESIQQYQFAAKNTVNQSLKSNIKCTIALLQQHKSKENVEELLQSAIMGQQNDPTSLITIRTIVNCILIDMLQGKGMRALEYFDGLLAMIEQENSLYHRKSLIEYISYLLFRSRNLEQMSQYIQSMDLNGLKAEEIFSISLMAFNSELCHLQSQQRVQRLCYEQYVKLKRYDLAIFCLRALIKFTKNSIPNRQHYERQLGKLVMLGYFNESIDYQNYESLQTLQTIVDKFIDFRCKLMQDINKMETQNVLAERQQRKEGQEGDKEVVVQWKYAIVLMARQVKKNKDIEAQSRKSVIDILQKMKDEQNILVVRSMIKNNYFLKYYQKVHAIMQSISRPLLNFTSILKESFSTLKQYQSTNHHQEPVVRDIKRSRLSMKSQRSRSALSKLKTKQAHKESMDKENNPPLGISIVSITSSKLSINKDRSRHRIFEDNRLLYTSKKVQKMVKMCEHGTFLNKRNFNSEGGQYRFVRITNSFIKWGKDPQKIETNCQIYPLKDIKSIVYGRQSPNLNQSCNKMLSYSKCFSLLLQKRTLDFYCKNYEELEGWVCGLSAVLKKQHMPIVGYSPGKLRWKKMFAILKQSFIEPLKANERSKYYYENAYSLILFGRNGYQLKKGQSCK